MMTKHRAFCGAVAALVLAIGSHAWADDLGDASDDVTIEDPAKTTSDAWADDLGDASDDVTIEDPNKAAREAMAKRHARIQKEKKESLLEQAPIVIDINRRYYKFYGDPNTVNGGILERSYLTGNWLGDGLRDKLVDAGV